MKRRTNLLHQLLGSLPTAPLRCPRKVPPICGNLKIEINQRRTLEGGRLGELITSRHNLPHAESRAYVIPYVEETSRVKKAHEQLQTDCEKQESLVEARKGLSLHPSNSSNSERITGVTQSTGIHQCCLKRNSSTLCGT